MNILCKLGIHKWNYVFSTKLDSNYRECKICKKQQISALPQGFINIDFKII